MNHRPKVLVAVSLLVVARVADAGEPVFRRLSLPGHATSTVSTSYTRVTPNGEWIVFRQDATLAGVHELYAVRRQTGAVPVRLSPPPGVGTRVVDFRLVGSSRVVFVWVPDPTLPAQLLSVPIGGPATAAVELSPQLAGGTVAFAFEVSRDASRVVFAAPTSVAGAPELWSAPVAGPAGSAVRLSPSLPTNGSGVFWFSISPDSSRVVFRGDFALADVSEVWSVPIGGPSGVAVKLHPDLGGSQDVLDFLVDSTSQRVVSRGDFLADGVLRLLSTPLAGPAAAGVFLDPEPLGGEGVRSYAITPDGARVVFTGSYAELDQTELWSAPLAGPQGTATMLHPAPVAGGDVGLGFTISPDSARVGFTGDVLEDGTNEVYVAELGEAGPQLRVLNPYLAGSEPATPPVFSRDGEHVAFVGSFGAASALRLYLADPEGASRNGVDVSGGVAAGGGVDSFRFSATSDRLVFRGDLTIDERYWLYSVPTAGMPTRTTLTNYLLAPDADVGIWTTSPVGDWIALVADPVLDDRLDLRRAHADGSPGGGPYSQILGDDADVSQFAWIGDGAGVLYVVTQPGPWELWIADEWVFASDFEEGDVSEWSSSAP